MSPTPPQHPLLDAMNTLLTEEGQKILTILAGRDVRVQLAILGVVANHVLDAMPDPDDRRQLAGSWCLKVLEDFA